MRLATIAVTLVLGDTDSPDVVVREAIANLADVMAVQAEDGLWTLGSPDAENEAGSSEHVADFTSVLVTWAAS